MNKVLKELRPFRVPLIILAVFAVVMIVVGVILPKVNSAIANSTPIVSIEATNDKVYDKDDEIHLSDFNVTATHENGRTSTVSASELEMSDVTISPIGATTVVSLHLASDPTISCEATVSIKREKVVSFQCGYPEISGVTAVLYTNGELCFEGSGDVLISDEGDFPWLDYEGMDDYPITAVSFEEGVAPTNMNYWFEDIETLTYVAPIPSSVRTMERTFSGCTGLTVAADWSSCEALLNINQIYQDCTNLVTTYPLLPSTRTATQAFAGCVNLTTCPDSSQATALARCNEMYADCSRLVTAEIPVGALNISGIFSNCINLKDMPEIPNGVTDMTSAFEDDISLTAMTTIPASVQVLDRAFQNCQMLEGEVTINCDAQDSSNVFKGACVATRLNLVGSSMMLDAYANTNDYANVYVNGYSPDASIKDYDDALEAQEAAAAAAAAAQQAETTETPADTGETAETVDNQTDTATEG